MDSLAEYHEKTGVRTVHFVLFPDRVHAKGQNNWGTQFETSIQLSDLRPHPSITKQYGLYFFYCIAFGVIMMAMAYFQNDELTEIMMIIGGVGIVIALVFFGRRVTMYHYLGSAGLVLLSIAQMPNAMYEFEEFISKLETQIKAHQPVSNPTHP